jgi:hypothetical protein
MCMMKNTNNILKNLTKYSDGIIIENITNNILHLRYQMCKKTNKKNS